LLQAPGPSRQRIGSQLSTGFYSWKPVKIGISPAKILGFTAEMPDLNHQRLGIDKKNGFDQKDNAREAANKIGVGISAKSERNQ